MKKYKALTYLLILFILFLGIFFHIKINDEEKPITKPAHLEQIRNGKSVIVFHEQKGVMNRGEFNTMPASVNYQDCFSVDLRSYDLSSINLQEHKRVLEYLSFDTNTIWPSILPDDFAPNEILELGKNPGLNIRTLHDEGITGKGVNIAIIDSALLVEHMEYADNIMLYELNHDLDKTAQMHGAAVTSIAVGKSVGVAPEAKVYYISSTCGNITKNGAEVDLQYIADSIYRILEINRNMPNDERISVISISKGISKSDKGYKSVIEAIDDAKKENIFVITTTPEWNYNFYLKGLGRGLYDNPDDFSIYTPGLLGIEMMNYDDYEEETIWVPMDSRAYAFCTGTSDYAFNRQGGYSFTPPWLAGMYALCVQVKPDITPDEFIDIMLDTGNNFEYWCMDKKIQIGIIIDPLKLIDKLSYS